MYQPDFPPVPFRLGLYPVVDSVAWIERLLEAGYVPFSYASKTGATAKWRMT
ncbi:thiamin-phosphate pyrophosphorylase [Klebsiella pneumoniae]|uniref:Thiamin-phosphate pyrophosphorylase n=1 Tax=Klebsiella pneumoniae TaxID=573 RepID=A0A377ZQF8_KLEPN|nr:thiamin-phosphate pyrophosphorylase [Klebsiella pneumoniae]